MKYKLKKTIKTITLQFTTTLITILLLNMCFAENYVHAKDYTLNVNLFSAVFFLYDPEGYTPVITNVPTSICTYIGSGTLSAMNTVYNNPEEVTSRIIKEPDYKTILHTNYDIEWSSIYTYNGYLIVIGRYLNIKNSSSSLSKKKNSKQTIPSIISPIELNKPEILTSTKESYPTGSYLKWNGFSNWGYKNDTNDGIIPVELFDDPIYCSMNLPSEAMSAYSKSVNRENGHINTKLTPTQTTAVGIGAIYLIDGQEMSRDFTICLGKIGLYAFSKSQNKWVVVDEQDTCKGLKMYQLPWTSGKHYQCDNIQYFDDHVEVTLGKDEINNYAFHFWGVRKPINQSDYLYYATAYQVWVKGNTVLTAEF